jgi:serine/threonine protein kinase
MMRLEIGECVGPYRILGELGGGGMGVVYQAVHVLLHRPAAIKVLRPELGHIAMASDRFLTEARATTAIRHPGIVEVYDYGHTRDGQAFIAMELLAGETLAERLRRQGPLTTVEAMTIARRIAAPLTAAHERGVVHRDLKPENVFLIKDHEGGSIDQVKLLDFGIAKLESTATAQRTALGLVLGTPAYMAPEQCIGAECDHRADLYALGCILFEMLAGRTPYSAAHTSDLLSAHMRQPIPNIARLVTVPADVTRLVTTLLAKSPQDRPPTAADVVTEIDRWLHSHTPRVMKPRSSLRTAIAIASGIVFSFSAIGAWYRWWRSPARAAVADMSTQDATIERESLAAGSRVLVDTSAPTIIQVDAGVIDAPPLVLDAARRRAARPIDARLDEVTPDIGSAAVGGVDSVVIDVDDQLMEQEPARSPESR